LQVGTQAGRVHEPAQAGQRITCQTGPYNKEQSALLPGRQGLLTASLTGAPQARAA
jgi:hypothetical protein